MSKKGKNLLILVALILFPISASPNQKCVIKAGRLIDGKSDASHRGVVIVISGGKPGNRVFGFTRPGFSHGL